MKKRFAIVVVLALAIGACSSDKVPQLVGADGGPIVAAVDAAADAGPRCPTAPPVAGDTCATPATCEYGSDGACPLLVSCEVPSQGPARWAEYPARSGCGTLGPKCPATFREREGTRCTVSDDVCDYAEGRCGCNRCTTEAGGSGGIWHCNAWNEVGAGCPVPRPLLGSACTSEGTSCDYEVCCRGPSLGRSMRCSGGTWQPYASGACSCGIPACP